METRTQLRLKLVGLACDFRAWAQSEVVIPSGILWFFIAQLFVCAGYIIGTTAHLLNN